MLRPVIIIKDYLSLLSPIMVIADWLKSIHMTNHASHVSHPNEIADFILNATKEK
jgi:hypothetical protein